MDGMDLMDGMDGMDLMDGMDHGQHTAIRWPHRHTSRRYTLQRFALRVHHVHSVHQVHGTLRRAKRAPAR